MGFSVPLALYHFFGPIHTRGQSPRRSSSKKNVRPPGTLIWLHAPDNEDYGVISELISQLSDHDPDLWFLLTTNDNIDSLLPDQCFHGLLPADTQAEMTKFLDHWKPNILIWAAGKLCPSLTHLAHARDIPLLLMDTGGAIEAARGWRLFPGLNRRTLRKFNVILSGDEATSLALIAEGARSENVRTVGVLEQGINPPPCIEAEWDTLTHLMSARPIWLAAEIDFNELGSVLAAHNQSMLRSHKLLLILAPANVEEGDRFASVLRESDFRFSQRSLGEEPSLEDQVYLADTEDEIGLWYRLSPVTFMGQTLAGPTDSGPNPFDAATLGSVVVHGPNIAAHRVAYQRMERAGASRLVAHMGELAHAVETFLAPDRAAIMAQAAWQITSAGAEVMESTINTLIQEIDRQGGSR